MITIIALLVFAAILGAMGCDSRGNPEDQPAGKSWNPMTRRWS